MQDRAALHTCVTKTASPLVKTGSPVGTIRNPRARDQTERATELTRGDAGARTAHREDVSPVVSVVEGTVVGVIALLAGAGVLLLAGVGDIFRGFPLHQRAGDLLVLLGIVLVIASYASGVHRTHNTRWRLHVVVAILAPTLYVIGDAAVADAAGALGRAHIADVTGTAPSVAATRGFHAAAGGLVALSALALGVIAYRAPSTGARARLAWSAVAGSASSLVAARAFPVAARLPENVGERFVTPPWPAIALGPLEEWVSLPTLIALAAVPVVFLLSLPFIDRPDRAPWVRRASTLVVVASVSAFLFLLGIGSLANRGLHA